MAFTPGLNVAPLLWASSYFSSRVHAVTYVTGKVRPARTAFAEYVLSPVYFSSQTSVRYQSFLSETSFRYQSFLSQLPFVINPSLSLELLSQ